MAMNLLSEDRTELLLIVFLGCCVAIAQQDDGIAMEGHMHNGSLVFETAVVDGPRAEGSLVVGQPYSAVQVSEHTQALANGTTIHQRWETSRLYRDSQGRTRTEQYVVAGALPVHTVEPGRRMVRICDPVGGYSYVLDTKRHIAHRLKILTMAEASNRAQSPESVDATRLARRAPANPALNSAQHPETKQEALGKEVADGVEVAVRKITMTTPTGLDGNDQPLVRVCENQYSEELKLTILSKCSDPRAGDTVTRLENLDRADPDPALFQVPPDYTVVEEKDQFRIDLGAAETNER
jgi:hypothetical protein